MMAVRWPILLLTLTLLGSALSAAAQDPSQGPSQDPSESPAENTEDPAGTSDAPADGDVQAPADDPQADPNGQNETADLPGNITAAPADDAPPENRTDMPPYLGTHVQFEIKYDGIANYTVDARPLFALIRFSPALDPTPAKEEGPDVSVRGRGGDFDAVDTADGHFRVVPIEGTIDIKLDERMSGIAAPASAKDIDEGRFTILDRNGLVGWVIGADLELLENDTVLRGTEARFLLHVPEAHTERPPAVTKAVEDGQIGAQVKVELKDDPTGDPAGWVIEAAPIATGRINMTVTGKEGYVFATVDGHGNGTALLFTVDRSILDGAIDVRYDGQPIKQAADLADVLDAGRHEQPEYLVLVGANVTQVLVAVPHFSVHVIELSSAGPIEVLVPILTRGSPWVFAIAALVAVGFVVSTSRLRSRQR